MAHKNVGSIPAPGAFLPPDTQLLDAARAAFVTVGELLGRARFKAAITEAMRVVGLANKYLSDQEPWKLGGDPERRDTVLHVALQAVQDCNTLLTPFLPHAAQKVYEALGGTGVWAAQPEIATVEEVGGPSYPVLRGDYLAQLARWESSPVAVGTPLAKPTPIFRKLDETLARTGPAWAPVEEG